MKSFPLILGALLAAALPAAAQAQPRSIDRSGTVSHRQAEAHFPERVGDFRRVGVTQYDEAGTDISANYDLARPNGQMRISVYVYPAATVAAGPGSRDSAAVARATLCDQEFRTVRQAITNQYPDAAAAEEGQAPAAEGVDRALSRRAVYRLSMKLGEGAEPMRSEVDLYCYVRGRWLVKYRASSTPGIDAAREIESFIRNGPWPGRNPPPSPDEAVTAPANEDPAPA